MVAVYNTGYAAAFDIADGAFMWQARVKGDVVFSSDVPKEAISIIATSPPNVFVAAMYGQNLKVRSVIVFQSIACY